MEIKFNKGFAIIVIVILILIYVLGQIFILSYIDFIRQDISYELSIRDILVTSLSSIMGNFNRLVIGIWLFASASKFQQDKWSWFVIGLAFGQLGLIFLAILLIVHNIKLKVDFNKALIPVLILLIISYLLNPASSFIFKPYLVKILRITDIGLFTNYNSYLSFFSYVIVVVIHVILATKLYKLIGQLQIKGKFLWAVSTVFLGLFPVILFNELIMTKTENIQQP